MTTFSDPKFRLFFFVGIAFATLASATPPDTKSSKSPKTMKPTAQPTVSVTVATTKSSKAPKSLSVVNGDYSTITIVDMDPSCVLDMATSVGFDMTDIFVCGSSVVPMEAVTGLCGCNFESIQCDCTSWATATFVFEENETTEDVVGDFTFDSMLCLAGLADGGMAAMVELLGSVSEAGEEIQSMEVLPSLTSKASKKGSVLPISF